MPREAFEPPHDVSRCHATRRVLFSRGSWRWLLAVSAASLFFSGGSAPAQNIIGTLDRQVVEITRQGGCDTISHVTNIYSASVSNAPISWSVSSCPGSVTFTGSVVLNFPQFTPAGTQSGGGSSLTFPFLNPLQISLGATGTWVVAQASGSRALLTTALPYANQVTGCEVRSTNGPPIPAGSYQVSVLAPCDRTGLTRIRREGSDDIYEIQSDVNVLYVYDFAGGTLAGASIKVHSEYRVSGAPRIYLNPTQLSYLSTGTSAPPSQVVVLSVTGKSNLNFTVASQTANGINWLSATPAAGTLAPGAQTNLTVSVNTNGLPSGFHGGTVQVSGNASNSPQNVSVVLTVPIFGDAISMSGVPAPGTQFPAGTPASFVADVQYILQTRAKADVQLRATNQLGNVLASSELVRIGQGNASLPGLTIDPFGLATTTNLTFDALLKDADTGAVLARSFVSYAVGPPHLLPIQLGKDEGGFVPTNLPVLFANNGNISDQLGAFMYAKTQLPASPFDRLLILHMRGLRPNGQFLFWTITKFVASGSGGDVLVSTEPWDKQPFVMQTQPVVSLDFWFELYTQDEPRLFSPTNTIPVDCLSLAGNPADLAPLLYRVYDTVIFKLDVTTAFSGDRQFMGLDGSASPAVLMFRDSIFDVLSLAANPRFVLLRTNTFAITNYSQATKLVFRLDSDRGHAESWPVTFPVATPYDILAGITPQGPAALNARLANIFSGLTRHGTLIARPTELWRLVHDPPPDSLQFSPPGAQTLKLLPVFCGAAFGDFLGVNHVWEFTPPIPADGSFTATLILTNNPNDFPDDPNFNEAACNIFSFDPVTQQLAALPTTINLADHTATAPITSLARYYSVGVTGPLAQAAICFPLISTAPNLNATAQFLNRGSNPVQLNLTAYHVSGGALTNGGVTNPLAMTLPPGLTNRSLAGIFNLPADTTGWTLSYASNGLLGSFVLSSASKCEALPLPAPALQQVLPDARLDSACTTEIHVANSTRFSSSVTLELRDKNGGSVATNQTLLGPKAAIAERLDTLFTNLSQPFAGYVIVQGEQPLAGTELLIGSKSLAALNGQTPTCATRLYAPRFTVGNGYASTVVVVNPTTNTVSVTVRAINDSGANLATPASFSLAAGKPFRTNAAALLGLSTATGSIVVDGSVGGLVGSVFISDTNAAPTFAAAFPLVTGAAQNWAVPCVPLGGSFFREISLLNTNGATANATIKFFQPNASLVGTANVSIAASGRMTTNLGSLLPASAAATNGYFMVEASAPVIVSGMTGENSGNTLSPLPAQSFSIAAAAATSSCSLPTGLISWWRAEGNANDSAGTNNGVANNGATFATGKIGQGFSLDGVGDFFEFPTNGLHLLTGNFTIEGWLKTTTTKSYSAILGFDGYYPGLYIYTSGGYLDLYPAGSSATGGFNDGQWHHFAVCRSTNTLTYYKDGVAAGTTTYFSSIAPARFTIGSSLIGSEMFPGLIDEVAIYNRALTTNEIAAIATGSDIKCPGPPPSLAIQRVGNAAVLSWPSAAAGFNLYGATNVTAGSVWQSITNPPALNSGFYQVTNPITGSRQYFRLQRP